MSFSEPKGSDLKKAAAWELVTVSIILFVMIVYRLSPTSYSPFSLIPQSITKPISNGVGYFMGENSMVHTLLYVLLLVLVLSSVIIGFFYNDE
jgi:hypothetical protein